MAAIGEQELSMGDGGARASRSRLGPAVALALLLVAVTLPGWLLRGELSAPPDLNDTLVHQALTAAVLDEWEAGRSGLDPWIGDWAFGYPVLHHYQPGAYWLTAAFVRLLPGEVSVAQAVDWLTWGLQTFFPLLICATVGWLGLGWVEAVAAALLATLVSSPGLYGWEFGSFGWGGSGLYAQLVATWFFVPALAAGYRALRGAGRVWPAALLLALTALCHLIYGYMAAIALLGLLLPRTAQLRRLAGLYIGTALLTAFFVIPFLLDREFVLHSRWEPAWKWASFGWARAWNLLASGDLFDAGKFSLAGRELVRPPIILLPAAVGTWVGRRQAAFRFLGATAAFWFAVFLGRDTWGRLLLLLPFSSELHLHRMVGPAQVLVAVAAGTGLVGLLRWSRQAGERGQRWQRLAVLGCVLLGLAAAVAERAHYTATTRGWMEQTRAALAARPGLLPALTTFDPNVAGRVFAGRAQDFGRDLRVGSVPFYALLAGARVRALSYLYMAMAPPSDFLALYDPARLAHSEIFGVSTQILPAAESLPEGATCLRRAREFQVVRLATTPWFALLDRVADLVTSSEEDSYQACAAWLAGGGPEQGAVFRMLRVGPPAISVFPGQRRGAETFWRLPDGTRVPGPTPPPGLFARTAEEGAARAASVSAGRRGEITDVAVAATGGRWRARVNLRRPAELLLAVSFHPGLRAWVDGEEVAVDELALHFAGVALPTPGLHEVRIEYRSRSWCLPVLAAGLLLFAVAVILEERSRRRHSFSFPPRLPLLRGLLHRSGHSP